MAIKPISHKPIFTIDTQSLGRLEFLPLTVRARRVLGEIGGISLSEFIDRLIVAVGQKVDGSELRRDEAAGLKEEEREEFATKFLDANSHLYGPVTIRIGEGPEGQKASKLRGGEIKHPRLDGEGDQEYLLRLFRLQDEESHQRNLKLMEPFREALAAHQNMFTPPFIEALKESQSAADQLGAMTERIRADTNDLKGLAARDIFTDLHPPHPELPNLESPVLETNERLAEVTARLEAMGELALQMADTVKSVSDSASQFLVAFSAASDNADRASRSALRVATWAVVLAVLSLVIQIGYSEWRAFRDRSEAGSTVAIGSNPTLGALA